MFRDIIWDFFAGLYTLIFLFRETDFLLALGAFFCAVGSVYVTVQLYKSIDRKQK